MSDVDCIMRYVRVLTQGLFLINISQHSNLIFRYNPKFLRQIMCQNQFKEEDLID